MISYPVDLTEPIQFWSHDEAASRYSEHQRTSQRFIFVMFALHNLSPKSYEPIHHPRRRAIVGGHASAGDSRIVREKGPSPLSRIILTN
jgi:hypothetical protein